MENFSKLVADHEFLTLFLCHNYTRQSVYNKASIFRHQTRIKYYMNPYGKKLYLSKETVL
jgi:hypothetical protein